MPDAEGCLLALFHAEWAGRTTDIGEHDETELVASFQEDKPCVHLLYLSTSFLWWQAVAGIVGITSRTALRMHLRCA